MSSCRRHRPSSRQALLCLLSALFWLNGCDSGSEPDNGLDATIDQVGDVLVFDAEDPPYDISGDWIMLRHSFAAPSTETPMQADVTETSFEQSGVVFTQFFGPGDTEGVSGTVAGMVYTQTDGSFTAQIELEDEDHGTGTFREDAFRFDFELARAGASPFDVAADWITADSSELPAEVIVTGEELVVVFDGETFVGRIGGDTGLLTAQSPPANASRAAQVRWSDVNNATLQVFETSWVAVGAGHTGRAVETTTYELVREGGPITTGSLRVTASTSGSGSDDDGYVVSVDGSDYDLDADGEVLVGGLAVGSYQVELADLAPGCAVDGSNPVSASVVAGVVTPVAFAVVCSSDTGSIRVTIETSGDGSDDDGYVVVVDGDEYDADVDDVVTIGDLLVGTYDVELVDLAGSCSVDGDNPASVAVAAGGTAEVAFAVVCELPCDTRFDVDVDRVNCGDCDAACDEGDFCNAASCVPLRPLSRSLVWLDFQRGLDDRIEGRHDGVEVDGEVTFDSADGSSRAAVFDGGTQIDLAFSGDFDLSTTSSHTITMWLRPAAVGDGGAIFAMSAPGGVDPSEHVPTLILRPDYNVALDYFFVNFIQTGPAPADTWSFVSVVVDGDAGTQTLRVWPQGGDPLVANGTMVGGDDSLAEDPWVMNLGNTYLGNWNGYEGMIDDFAFFNRALTEAELQTVAGSSPSACYRGAPVCSIDEPVTASCDDEPCYDGVSCTERPGEDPPYECGDCPAGTEGDGESCDDIDGCAGGPCYPGVACTDIAAPDTGFDCGDCPAGTTGDGITCTAVACEPACEGWQECVSGSCRARRCSNQGQCPGGYCFQGTCRNDGTCASRCSAVYGASHTWQCISEGYCQINDCSSASNCPSGYDCVSTTDNSRGPGGASLFDRVCMSGSSSPCGGTCRSVCSATSGSCAF